MPFLEINGIDVPVAVDTLTETVREVGKTVQAFSGTSIRSRIAVKRDLEFEVPLLEPVLAGQLERWIRGEGELWTFGTLYGSKGTAPESGYAGSVGSGILSIPNGSSHAYRISPTGSSWTVCFNWSSTFVTSFSHYVVTSAGKKWVNGVRNDAASTAFLAVSNGIATFTASTIYTRVDNLFAFPATVDDTWPPSFYGTGGNGAVASGLASPPNLRLTGDCILETTRTALGEVTGTSVFAAAGATRRTLSVRLSQV